MDNHIPVKAYIVYRWTNKATHQFYFGSHKVNDITQGLDDGYIASGKYFLEEYHKSPEDWTREVLDVFDTLEEALERERVYVNRTMVKNPQCLNHQVGGRGSWEKVNAMPRHLLFPESRIERLREIAYRRYELLKRENKWNLGPSSWKSYDYSEHSKRMSGANNPSAKPVSLTNNETGEVFEFETLAKASKDTGLSKTMIRKICRGEEVPTKGRKDYMAIRERWSGRFL